MLATVLQKEVNKLLYKAFEKWVHLRDIQERMLILEIDTMLVCFWGRFSKLGPCNACSKEG